jgi:ribosome assembly protein 1
MSSTSSQFACLTNPVYYSDSTLLEKITKALSIQLPAHVLRSRDPRNILTAVFSTWLPLSTAVLVSVMEYLPSPPDSQALRLQDMIDDSPGAEYVSPVVRDAMVNFRTDEDAPVVAYVSKMVSIPESELPSRTRRKGDPLSAEEALNLARKKRDELSRMQSPEDKARVDSVPHLTNAVSEMGFRENGVENGEEKEDPERLIGFARLYSGKLSVGDSIYVLPPKFSPQDPHAAPEPQLVTVTALYLLMGRSLEHLETVPAGVVFGIAGLEGHIMKTGTLCSRLEGGVNLAGVSLSSPPIVRVALEPVNPGDLQKMITGLKLLERSDPCAQYEVLPSGEHVILTAGELHLERCLKDLRERFAKCDVQAGEAIVPYRETILRVPDMAPAKNPDLGRGRVLAGSTNKQLAIQLRVRPLPEAVTELLIKNEGTIKQLNRVRHGKSSRNGEAISDPRVIEGPNEAVGTSSRSLLSIDDLKTQLVKAFAESKEEVWRDVLGQIVEFGPRKTGPNILVDSTPDGVYERL